MEFESELTGSRHESATILRDVAEGIGGGTLRVRVNDEDLLIDVPEELDIEIEYEFVDEHVNVEFELEFQGALRDNEDRSGMSFESRQEIVHDDGANAGSKPSHVGNRVAEGSQGEDELTVIGSASPSESLARFEVYRDKSDEWRWRLVHRNGNIIASSGEGYTRRHNALKGLQSVMRNSPRARIDDEPDG